MLVGTQQWQRRVCWKLVVALPAVSQHCIKLSDWLKCKLSVGSVPSKDADSQVKYCYHRCTADPLFKALSDSIEFIGAIQINLSI